MFCPNCGFQNADNDVFCQQCGTKLNDSKPSAAQDIGNPQPEHQPEYQPQVSISPLRSSHPVLNAVKNIAASPLYLTAIIAFSVGLFFSFISLFGMKDRIVGNLDNYFAQFGINNYNNFGDFEGVFNTFYNYITVWGFILLIPTVLYAVGMWMTYASAINRKSDSMSTSGLTLIKVIRIISLVFSCILFAILELACIIVIIGTQNMPNDYDIYPSINVITIVFTVLAVLILIVAIFSILYIAKTISSINAVTKTVITGNPIYKVSGFVAVMNFIIAGGSLFTLFSGGALAAFSELCDITALVCFALLLFKYNDAMRSFAPQIINGGFAQPYNNTNPQTQYPNGGQM